MKKNVSRTQFDQLIERVAYPTDTRTLVEFMRQHGTGDDVVNMATMLNIQTFKNPEEVRRALKEKIYS